MFSIKSMLSVLVLSAALSANLCTQDTRTESADAHPISLANVSSLRQIDSIPFDAHEIVWGPGRGRVSLLGWETSVSVHDAQSLRCEKQLAANRKLVHFAINPDGQTYAWCENNADVELRNDRVGNVFTLKTGNPQPSVTFSSNGKLLATGGYGTHAKVWNSATGELSRSFNAGPTVGGLTPAFSPNGQLLAVGNRNSVTHIYEVGTGNLRFQLPRPSSQELRFSPNGKVLAVAYVDGSIALWDMTNGKLLHARKEVAQEVYSLDWSPAGDMLVTSGRVGKIVIWDSRNLNAVKELDAPEWVIRVRFNPEGNRLFSCGGGELPSDKRSVTIWGLAK